METIPGWDSHPVVAAWAGLPTLVGPVTADVCVVGLGGSGLAAIGAALDRGLSVVGVDAGRVAAGAAGRNGGFLIAGPEPALHVAVDRWGYAAVDLYRDTLAEIDALEALLGTSTIRRVGSIRLAGLPAVLPSEAGDRRAELLDCGKQRTAMDEFGFEVESYSGPLGEGLYFPRDAVMNPAVRALGLASIYGHHAALYENSPMVSVSSSPDGAVVATSRGQVSAGQVVIAVDGRLDTLVPSLAPYVRTARLQMLSTQPLSAPIAAGKRLPCPVYARRGYDYAQLDPSGSLFVGGGRDRFEADEWTTSDQPTPDVQRWIEECARRFAGQAVKVAHRWAASVGFTPDEKAVVARVGPGVVACGGYSGTGNLVGPIAARAALAFGLEGTQPQEYFTVVE